MEGSRALETANKGTVGAGHVCAEGRREGPMVAGLGPFTQRSLIRFQNSRRMVFMPSVQKT